MVLEKKNVVPVHNIPFQVTFSSVLPLHFLSIDFIICVSVLLGTFCVSGMI